MLAPYLDGVLNNAPRIHCITNGVSAPLCANGLMAIGAAPVMAEAPEEVADITAICQGLCLNLGMPHPQKIKAMILAGQTANESGIPVVLDPVGVGASQFRRDSVRGLMETVRFTVIRGNLSEIKTLAGEMGQCLGVDAGDVVTAETLPQVVALGNRLAQSTGAVVVISSAIDVVADGNRAYVLSNGHPMLARLSGSGCLLSAVLTAYVAANPQSPLEACVAGCCAFGLCGERAASQSQGVGSFAVHLLDALATLTPEQVQQEARYEAH